MPPVNSFAFLDTNIPPATMATITTTIATTARIPHPIATFAPVDMPVFGGGVAGEDGGTGVWGSVMITSWFLG
jgi:hypothetical protein